jgi:hypothetical protein
MLRPRAPWDPPGGLPFPAIRRLVVTTWEVARTLPKPFRRLGTRYLEGVISPLRRGVEPSVVALDPGGDLAHWPELRWHDRRTGKWRRVTTDLTDVDAVLLDTLDWRAVDWMERKPSPTINAVSVERLRLKIVGAASGVIDAELDGLSDPGARRVVHRDLDRLAIVHADAARLGKREFMRRTGLSEGVAMRTVRQQPISARNVERALRGLAREAPWRRCGLEGCDETLVLARSRYCSKAHRDRAYRSRKSREPSQTSRRPGGVRPAVHPTCPFCDTVLVGVAATRGTCSRHAAMD